MLDDADRDKRGLTEQERQLLDLVREGKVDAEMAVRLGISNAEVKERVERLRWKLRARDRGELRAPAADPEPPDPARARERQGIPLVAVAALAALALAGGAAAGWLLRGGGEASLPAAPTTSTVSTVPPTVPLPTQTPYVTEIAGRRMELLGQPFSARSNFVQANVESRETLLVAKLAQPVILRYSEFLDDVRLVGGGSSSFALSVQQNERSILLVFVLEPGGQVIYGDNDSLALFASNAPGPTVVMYARAPEGPQYYHLELDAGGRLYVSEDGVPAATAFAFDTGELLDLGGATQIGETRLSDHWIFCDLEAGAECTSLLRGDFTPSVPGTLTCNDLDGTLTFATLDFVLSLEWSTTTVLKCQTAVRRVPAAEPLGYPDAYAVSARDAHTAPLSVVITRAGAVYVGDVTPKFACPCRSGN